MITRHPCKTADKFTVEKDGWAASCAFAIIEQRNRQSQESTMANQPIIETEDKQTGRIEAFSDGVLAIAITLLALELKVPRASEEPGSSLIQELVKQWPMYLAFVISFFFILVIWINHHRLFTVIRRSDNNLLILNGLLLFGVTILPFATELVAEYLQQPEQNTAAVIYNGIFLVVSIFFNVLWRYASYKNRLFDRKTDLHLVAFISRQYAFGPLLYLIAVIVSGFSAVGGLTMSLIIAVFFALPNKSVQRMMDEAQATDG
jgi:uncharacterized membrane protein